MPPDPPPSPRTLRHLWILFGVVLLLTLGAGLFVPSEAHEGIGATFGFGAWFGFVACAALILVAKGLGAVLKRPDDHYERPDD